ncbi:MAG: UbiA family prenyltransferase, partial [Roseovarius sp.]|nr:UbiA family prenyltransferase [Roseovarius sp.]
MIAETYGAEPYAYIGDSTSDLPVWAGAQRAITVDASAGLRRRLESTGAQAEHLRTTTGSDTPQGYLAALRPHQWLKNLLVFAPVIASHATQPAVIAQAVLAFVAFCLVSSAGYVFNDLMDLRADRMHPRKALRPLASGRVPIAHGTAMVPLLLVAGLGLAAIGGGALLAVIAGYFALTVTYSLSLKRIAIADICTLAGLYTMRILAGALATGLVPSVWLLAFSHVPLRGACGDQAAGRACWTCSGAACPRPSGAAIR